MPPFTVSFPASITKLIFLPPAAAFSFHEIAPKSRDLICAGNSHKREQSSKQTQGRRVRLFIIREMQLTVFGGDYPLMTSKVEQKINTIIINQNSTAVNVCGIMVGLTGTAVETEKPKIQTAVTRRAGISLCRIHPKEVIQCRENSDGPQ